MQFGPFVLGLSLCCAATPSAAQQREGSATPSTRHAVPRLVKYGDVVRDGSGAPRRGTVGVTFAVYAEREGGSALWMETQNVDLDEQGRYSAMLGAVSREGLPADLFATGESRWLGVHVQLPGESEQARVLLVSVPYAMRAEDAASLGGRPATAYVLREHLTGWSGVLPPTRAPGDGGEFVVDGTGTAGTIPMFTSSTVIGNSQIFQNAGNIGIGTGGPGDKLHVNGNLLLHGQATHQVTMTGALTSGRIGQDGIGFFFAADTANRSMRVLTNDGSGLAARLNVYGNGNVGIGTDQFTPTPHRLEVAGGSIKLTGTGNGIIFPDGTALTTAAGDITAVNAGSGLVGGGANGDVTLGLLTSCATGQMLKWNGSAWGCDNDLTGGGFLPLSGGTLAGPLSGTTASFSDFAPSGSSATLVVSNPGTLGSAALIQGGSTGARITGAINTGVFIRANTLGIDVDLTGVSSKGIQAFAGVDATPGGAIGLWARSRASDGIAVLAENTSSGQGGIGLLGRTFSSSRNAGVAAGVFDNGSSQGEILIGLSNGAYKFAVNGDGSVRAGAYLDLAGNPIGGDITAVITNSGTGLQGGVSSGIATLSLISSCAIDQILKWNGSSWQCAADSGGSGGTFLPLSGGTLSGGLNGTTGNFTGSLISVTGRPSPSSQPTPTVATGVWGDSGSGTGVRGTTDSGAGVRGIGSSGAGVVGLSSTGNPIEGRNGAGNPVFTVSANGVVTASGIQHRSLAVVGFPANSAQQLTVLWSAAFADSNYTAVCSVIDVSSTAQALKVDHISLQNNASITVVVRNDDSIARSGTLRCLAIKF